MDSVVTKLIVYTVNRGILTSICAALNLSLVSPVRLYAF